MNYYRLSKPVQAIGLACVPFADISADEIIARKPVAVAIVTLATAADGRPAITAECPTAKCDSEFPLSYLVDRELITGAEKIVTPADRAVLLADAAARRFFVEPDLARMCSGRSCIDPVALAGEIDSDERILCRRLGIPVLARSDEANEPSWNKGFELPLKSAALAEAVSRLMLWSHLTAFRSAEPGLFFEPILALRGWMFDQAERAPDLYGWAKSRPIMRAVSFKNEYRQALARGDGEPWIRFEEGLSLV